MNLTELPPEGTSIKGSHFIPATPSKSFHAATLQQFQTNQNHRKNLNLSTIDTMKISITAIFIALAAAVSAAPVSTYLPDPQELHFFWVLVRNTNTLTGDRSSCQGCG